jgi:NADPH2:quinone reductase
VKAIRISRTGGPDVLDCVDVPTPSPGPGEVLVRASAIGVNYFDTMIRTGRYRWMPKLPFVLGNEMSGHVAAVGPGVTTLKAGQQVFVAGYEIGNRGGLYAEYAAVPEQAAWPLPAGIDVDQATALTNYQLAWILLHHAARGVTPKTVLVYGAAGGVGSALIDVARLAGATVIGTAGGAEKCTFVRQRGAANAIDYAKENMVERVLALTGGRGADILFDHVAGKALTEGLTMVTPLCMIVSYAVMGGMPETDCSRPCAATSKESRGALLHHAHLRSMEEPRREAMARGGTDEQRPSPARDRSADAAFEASRAHELIGQRRDGKDRARRRSLRFAEIGCPNRVSHSGIRRHVPRNGGNNATRGIPISARRWCWCSACRRRFATSISAMSFRASIFAVILLAFLASTILFTSPAHSRPRRVQSCGPRPHRADDEPHHGAGMVLLFFALSHLEPSIVNTMHSGMGPLTVVALAALGAPSPRPTGWMVRVFRLCRDRAVARRAGVGRAVGSIGTGGGETTASRASRRFSSVARRSR